MFIICATDTFFDWTVIFLESMFITNGDKHRISLSGINLTKDMIKVYKSIYPNIEISNVNDRKKIRKMFKMSKDQYERSTGGLNLGRKTGNRWFSQYVLKHRVKRLQETMEKYPEEEWFILYDVDMLIRKSIDPLVNQVKSHDVTLRFKQGNLKKRKTGHRIAGGLSGYSGEKGLEFVKKWNSLLSEIDLVKEWNGTIELYDQLTLYKTYEYFEDSDIKWSEIDTDWITPHFKQNKSVWGGHRKGAITVQKEPEKKAEKMRVINRNILREKVFFPEIERLRVEMKEKNVDWADRIKSEEEFNQLREGIEGIE